MHTLVHYVALAILLSFTLLPSGALRAESYGYDSRIAVAAGLPPSLLVDTWIGAYMLLKPITFGRQDPIFRKIERYSYTYFRPHLRFVSSGFVNRGALRLDVYPLAYIGGTLGYALTHKRLDGIESFSKWTGYNCQSQSCRDWQENMFLEFKLKGAWDRYYSVFLYRKDWIKSHTLKPASFDPESSLSLRAPHDSNHHFWGLVGFQTGSEKYSLRYRHIKWKGTKEELNALSALGVHDLSPQLSLQAETGYRWARVKNPFFSIKLEYVFKEEPTPQS